MQNVQLLIWITLKLLSGFGTMSQSKLSLQSIMATVFQVNDGFPGANQACAKYPPASKSPLTVHINSISPSSLQNIWLLHYLWASSAIHDALLSRIVPHKVEQGFKIIKLCNSPLIQYIASRTRCVCLILWCVFMCRKPSLAVHLCVAQSLVWINTGFQHFCKCCDKYLLEWAHKSLTNKIHPITNKVFKLHEDKHSCMVNCSCVKHTGRRAPPSTLPSIPSATWSPQKEHMGNVTMLALAARLLISAASFLSYNNHSSHATLRHTDACFFHALRYSFDPLCSLSVKSSDIKLKLVVVFSDRSLKHARPRSNICPVNL